MRYVEAALLILVLAPQATRGQVVDECQAAKIKAAGKNTYDKAKCREKALKKGVAIDPLCFTKAEGKFVQAMTRADTLGSCPGTAIELEAAVDQCVADHAALLTGVTGTTTTTTLCNPRTNPACPGTTTTTTTTPSASTTTTTMASEPCNTSQWPTCGGTCPAGQVCVSGISFCTCVESDNTCSFSRPPTCGGTCPNGEVCGWISRNPVLGLCGCVPPDETCRIAEAPTCGGACPDGYTCGHGSGEDSCKCVPLDNTCGISEWPTCGGTCPIGSCAPNEKGCYCAVDFCPFCL